MTKQGNSNDRINNTQRRELTRLAVGVLDRKIQQARDESGELVAQIREKVREELGFGKYQDSLIAGSKAKMLVDKRLL